MKTRTVSRIHDAVRDDIGSLVTRRALPTGSVSHLDPFLFLNHHGPQAYASGNDGLPFGPHPHRGFETVTFILEGDIAHRDSGGHESVIEAGGVQWMTAGRGLVHEEVSSEEFKRRGGPLEILQLWLNLPARLKMTDPSYVGLQRDKIPKKTLAAGKAQVELVAGTLLGEEAAFRPLTDVNLALVALEPGGTVTLPAPVGRQVFFYVIRGRVDVEGRAVARFQLAELDDGDAVTVAAAERALVLFGHGTPFGEPIVARGPFVMNSQAEIAQAIRDHQAGLLGK